MAVLNLKNDQRKIGAAPLFLGQPLGLHDSVNVGFPELFDVYKGLKSRDWAEDEATLLEDSLDFKNCSNSQYDVMIKTLSWQFEADSVASRAIAPLLAPFITNSEYWCGISYICQNETLHALTYSEIVRQCFTNPEEIFSEIESNTNITGRGANIVQVFDDLQVLGAKYTLGLLTKEDKEVKEGIVKAIVALYCLEQVSFMASFACTFAMVELDMFKGIGKLVQKIMIDEKDHALFGKLTLNIISKCPILGGTVKDLHITGWVQEFFDEVMAVEYEWSEYIFSEGRSILGLTPDVLKEWVSYKATDLADTLKLKHGRTYENPLLWMDKWLDIDSIQTPNQEEVNTNYLLNSITDDAGDEEMDFDF